MRPVLRVRYCCRVLGEEMQPSLRYVQSCPVFRQLVEADTSASDDSVRTCGFCGFDSVDVATTGETVLTSSIMLSFRLPDWGGVRQESSFKCPN